MLLTNGPCHSHSGHACTRVVTGFEFKPLLLSDSTLVKFSLKGKGGGEDLGGRERERKRESVHDHNKNLNFAGSLKDDLAQEDINIPKKVCEDPTLQVHCCCLLFSHPPLQ